MLFRAIPYQFWYDRTAKNVAQSTRFSLLPWGRHENPKMAQSLIMREHCAIRDFGQIGGNG
jgi:hypothetical protein